MHPTNHFLGEPGWLAPRSRGPSRSGAGVDEARDHTIHKVARDHDVPVAHSDEGDGVVVPLDHHRVVVRGRRRRQPADAHGVAVARGADLVLAAIDDVLEGEVAVVRQLVAAAVLDELGPVAAVVVSLFLLGVSRKKICWELP